MDLWLVKATRLLFNNNSDDIIKLNQMLQESLDPETEHKILKMNAEEAIADPINVRTSTILPPKKVKNVEIITKVTTKRSIPEETEKKKVQLLNVDIFSPSNVESNKRRKTVNTTNSSKEKTVLADPSNDAATAMMMSQEFSDLQCSICGSMSVAAADNMLLECHRCRVLYHQKCHKPHVSQADAVQATWCCIKCSVPIDLSTQKT